jgi:pyroglutamyl-peptidase
MTRVLLTAFEPFGGHPQNSSALVGEAVRAGPPAGLELAFTLLPVVAWRCLEAAWREVERFRPDVVVALGQAAGSAGLRLEDRGINIHHFPIPDNDGNLLRDEWIVPGAPPAYRTDLPWPDVLAGLRRAGLPAEWSFHAGTYVCNHLYYGLLHRSAQAGGPRVGFVHLPLVREQAPKGQRLPACGREVLVEGVRRVIAACA